MYTNEIQRSFCKVLILLSISKAGVSYDRDEYYTEVYQ